MADFRREFGLVKTRIRRSATPRGPTKRIRFFSNDFRKETRFLLQRWLKKVYNAEYAKSYTKTCKWKIISANNMAKRRAAMKETDIDTAFLLELWDQTTHCVLCHQPLGLDRHLDHIVPLIVGGKHLRGNVRYVHPSCNCSRPKDGSDFTND